MEKKRILWIDIAKGIAILLMILAHTLSDGSLARKVIFSFHMPLFFVLAGYTFRVKPAGELVRFSAIQLLVPYVLVYLGRLLISWVKQDAITASLVRDWVLGFVFASGTTVKNLDIPAAGMIWFLVVLFCCRVIMNSTEAWFDKFEVASWKRGLVYVACACVGVLIGGVAHIKLPLSFDIVLVALLFMYFGMMLKRFDASRYFDVWWVVLLVLAGWIACVSVSNLELAARRYDVFVFALTGACLGSCVVFSISYFIERYIGFLRRFLAWAGQNSLLLLCVHAFDRYYAPWANLPLVSGLPFEFFLAGCLRILIDVVVAFLMKKVSTR